jgi:PBP1b-binding outer membrane lipoprotein LpoB
MKKTIKLSLVTLGLLMIAGCKTASVTPMDEQKTVNTKTHYSQALRTANDMISVFFGKTIHIKVNDINDDATGGAKLPVKIDTVVNKSFNRIGDKVVTMRGYNPKKLPKNVYIVNGAITEFDVVFSDGMSTDVAAQGTHNGQSAQFNGGLSKGNKTTKLTLTLNPSNPRTGNFISRTSTDNTITIEQKNSASEFGFSILGTGIGLNSSVSRSHGLHASIDTLVELSVVEVLGRLVKYPYWILTGGEVNPDVIEHLSKKFLQDTVNSKIIKISYLLSLKGYKVKSTSIMNSQLSQVIKKYKVSHGMANNDIISNKLYMSLLKV